MGEIVDYCFNEDFIFIYRKISDEVKNHFNDHPFTEIMRGGDTLQYWTIQKKKDIIIGPLQKNDYYLKRIELNIPKNLQLKHY